MAAEIINHHPADGLQTLGTNLVNRVIRGVPWRVVKVDQIDGRNFDGIQRRVIVGDTSVIKIGEMIATLKGIGRSKNTSARCIRKSSVTSRAAVPSAAWHSNRKP